MKRTTLVLCLTVAALAALPALGRGIPKVLITSSGTSASASTGCGQFTIQCDAAICENSGSGAAVASCTLGGANTGRSIQAGQLFPEDLPCSGSDQADTVAIISVSGTANCQVWREAFNP